MNLNQTISQKFTIGDVLKSDTATRAGIAEQLTPSADVINNATALAIRLLDSIPYDFYINSWYRCPRLNKLVKGAANSDHQLGCAVDIDSQRNQNNANIFNHLLSRGEFDQLIWEFGNELAPEWVHVSYKTNNNRNQVLVAYKDATGRTKYKPYQPIKK